MPTPIISQYNIPHIFVNLPLTVWAYETGTFHMLTCARTLEANFANANGKIIVP